jgi:hypothetical protein
MKKELVIILALGAVLVGVVVVMLITGRFESHERRSERAREQARENVINALEFRDSLDAQGRITWEEPDELGVQRGRISEDAPFGVLFERITDESSAWLQFLGEIESEHGEGSPQHSAASSAQAQIFRAVDIAISESLRSGREVTFELLYDTIHSAWQALN